MGATGNAVLYIYNEGWQPEIKVRNSTYSINNNNIISNNDNDTEIYKVIVDKYQNNYLNIIKIENYKL